MSLESAIMISTYFGIIQITHGEQLIITENLLFKGFFH